MYCNIVFIDMSLYIYIQIDRYGYLFVYIYKCEVYVSYLYARRIPETGYCRALTGKLYNPEQSSW